MTRSVKKMQQKTLLFICVLSNNAVALTHEIFRALTTVWTPYHFAIDYHEENVLLFY